MWSLTALFLNLSSAFAVTGVFFSRFHPKLTAVECVAAGIPVGVTLSAWCALLVKSIGLTSAPGLSFGVIAWCLLFHFIAAGYMYLMLKQLMARGDKWSLLRAEFRDPKTRASLAFCGVVWLWFCWLLHTHCLREDTESRTFHVAGTTWADLPFHLNIMSSFLHGVNNNGTVFQPLRSAFFAHSNLAYPFLPDFHTAYNVAAGSSVREAMLVPGAMLLGSFALLLYRFNYRLTASHFAACASIPLTLFCGGIGFYHLWNNWTWDNFMTKDHIFHLVHAPDAFWFSLPAHILFPQRTTQFAYPVDLVILLLLYVSQIQAGDHKKTDDDGDEDDLMTGSGGGSGGGHRGGFSRGRRSSDVMVKDHGGFGGDRGSDGGDDVDGDDNPDSADPNPNSSILDDRPGATASPIMFAAGADASTARQLGKLPPSQTEAFQLKVAAGFVTGLLPFLQPHSFVAVGSVILVVAAMDVGARALQRHKKHSVMSAVGGWIAYGAVAFAVAGPQFIPFFARVADSKGFIRLNRWTPWGLVVQWARSLGLYVPIFALSLALIYRKRFAAVQFYAGLATVFVEANLIIFQPWELDNTKVFYVWVFGASGFVCMALWRFAKKFGPAGAVVAAVVYGSLIISGATLCLQESINDSTMFDAADVEYAQWIRENTPADSVFLTPSGHYPSHFRVESALAGRQILVGYAGWLSSHGLNYGQRMARQGQTMSGRGAAYQFLKESGTTHVTVPWTERHRFNMNFLNSVGTRVAANGRYAVYEIHRDELDLPIRDCGASSKTTCQEKGCLWLPQFEGPWCQVPHHRVAKEEPQDCGFVGITEKTCHDQWCSWFPNSDGPWCQQPRHAHSKPFKPMRLLSPDGDCGWANMDIPQCADRGCVWEPAGSNPWCTFRRDLNKDGPPPASVKVM